MSRDALARAMIAEFRSQGEKRPIRYDRAGFFLEIGKGDRLFLYNAHHECNAANRPTVDTVVKRYVKIHRESTNRDKEGFQQARGHLLPMVRDRIYFEAAEMLSETNERVGIPRRHLVEHLDASVAVDSALTTQTLTAKALEEWKRPFDDVFRVAVANLRKRSKEPFEKVAPGLYQSPWQDNYDPSRLLLMDLVQAVPVKGDRVVMVPNRITLLVSGTEEREGLARMLEEARKAYGEDRPLNLIALTLRGGHWIPWLPPAKDPLYAGFKRAQVESVLADYSQMAELREKALAKAGRKVRVAALEGVQSGPSQALTYTTWTRGQDWLLPRADVVVFAEDADGHRRTLAIVEWDEMWRLARPLLTAEPGYPPCYVTHGFPEAHTLDAMHRSAWMDEPPSPE